MKKLLLSLALIVGLGLNASADTYNYLTLTSSSVKQSFALKSVKKITFEGTNIVVTMADGTTSSTALSDFDNFAFTTETAIKTINESGSDLFVEAGRIVANGKGLLLLYNTNGQLVRQQLVNGNRSEIQLYDLPRGIYVAKIGNRTLKVIR